MYIQYRAFNKASLVGDAIGQFRCICSATPRWSSSYGDPVISRRHLSFSVRGGWGPGWFVGCSFITFPEDVRVSLSIRANRSRQFPGATRTSGLGVWLLCGNWSSTTGLRISEMLTLTTSIWLDPHPSSRVQGTAQSVLRFVLMEISSSSEHLIRRARDGFATWHQVIGWNT